MSPSNPLSATQQQVLTLIAAGTTARAAAESAGIHRNTISNWLRLSQFHDALSLAEYEQAVFQRDQALSLVPEAFAVIQAILADPKVPAGVRLKAALDILDRAAAPLPDAPDVPDTPEIVHNPVQSPTENQQHTAQLPYKPNPNADALRGDRSRIPRDQPCPCGSGIVFMRCCLGKAPSLRRTAA